MHLSKLSFFSSPPFHHVRTRKENYFLNVIVLFGSSRSLIKQFNHVRLFWIGIKWKCFHHKQASLWPKFPSYFLSPPTINRMKRFPRDLLSDIFRALAKCNVMQCGESSRKATRPSQMQNVGKPQEHVYENLWSVFMQAEASQSTTCVSIGGLLLALSWQEVNCCDVN